MPKILSEKAKTEFDKANPLSQKELEAVKRQFHRLERQPDLMEEAMQITINDIDFSKLKPATRQDIVAVLLSGTAPAIPEYDMEGFDWDEVVDLTPDEVEEFIEGCSEQTIAGLRIIAEHGPVIAANLLNEAGIENYGHFQGRVTKRTRTVTGDKKAYLFTWDDWQSEANAERGYGHYAVTEKTFRSLRRHFKLV